MENFSLYINGVLRTVCVPPQWTLLRVLRETLGLTGAKTDAPPATAAPAA